MRYFIKYLTWTYTVIYSSPAPMSGKVRKTPALGRKIARAILKGERRVLCNGKWYQFTMASDKGTTDC